MPARRGLYGRRIPWGRLLAEGAAIVLSILLAFAIDAAWDERQERRDEQEVLLALREDFINNRAGLERITRVRAAAEERVVRLHRRSREVVLALEPDSVAAILGSAIPPRSTGPGKRRCPDQRWRNATAP